MTVQFDDGTKLRIWFEHFPTSTYVNGEFQGNVFNKTGWAQVAPGDHHCKATGRRIALTRLMSKNLPFLEFTRERRRAVWAEYFKQHADLRHKQKAATA